MELVAKVPVKLGAEPVHVFVPLLPALGVVQEKLLRVSETVNVVKLPGVESATTIVPLPGVTVTLPAAGHIPIAVARFEAKVAKVELVAKVPVGLVGHVFEPIVPSVTVPHEKTPLLFDALTEKAETVWSPGVLSVTVTVFVLDNAETPAAVGHVVPITLARFDAKVFALALVAKVPVKVGAEPVHVAEPALPPLTAAHWKAPAAVGVTARKGPGFVCVTVT